MKYKLMLLIVILSCSAGSAIAQTGTNGTTLGMSGAYTTFARGSEALHWNPANLGFHEKDAPGFTMELFALNFRVTNNTFSLNEYDKYFTDENKVLTNQDKTDILGLVPESGLDLNVGAEIPIFTFAYKNFAFGMNTEIKSHLNMPKEMVDTFFNGIGQKPYDLEAGADVEVSTSFNFAYGRTIWKDMILTIPFLNSEVNLTDISVGASLAYNMGLVAVETEEGNLVYSLSDDGISIRGGLLGYGAPFIRTLNEDGDWETDIADEIDGASGSGFGLNIGMSAKSDNNYTYSLVLKNIVNQINWNTNAIKINREIDGEKPRFLLGSDSWDDLESDDYTHNLDSDVGSFKTTKPFGFRAAVGRDMHKYKYAVEIGMEYEEFLLAVGGSYKWHFINLFGGYNYFTGHSLTTGIGFGGERFMFDIAIGTFNGITPSSTTGSIFSTGLRYGF